MLLLSYLLLLASATVSLASPVRQAAFDAAENGELELTSASSPAPALDRQTKQEAGKPFPFVSDLRRTIGVGLTTLSVGRCSATSDHAHSAVSARRMIHSHPTGTLGTVFPDDNAQGLAGECAFLSASSTVC